MDSKVNERYLQLRRTFEDDKRCGADGFHIHFVTVGGLCEKDEHPEYAQQVKNRISAELKQHKEYTTYIQYEYPRSDDLRLTAEGIIAFFDILAGYFDPQALLDVAEYMWRLDKISDNDLAIECLTEQMRELLEQTPTATLKRDIAEYKAHGTINEVGMNDEICGLFEDELKERGPLHSFLHQIGGKRDTHPAALEILTK